MNEFSPEMRGLADVAARVAEALLYGVMLLQKKIRRIGTIER